MYGIVNNSFRKYLVESYDDEHYVEILGISGVQNIRGTCRVLQSYCNNQGYLYDNEIYRKEKKCQ